MLLKYVLSFYQVDNVNQQLRKQASSKFCRIYFGFRYGRPVTLLDTAKYVKEDWDKITDETMKNAFINADLRKSLDSAVT